MKYLLLDPLLLSIPHEGSSGTHVKNWFESLNAWLGEVENSIHTWCCSANCLNNAIETNTLPSFNTLRSLTRQHNLDFNTTLISKRFTEFIRNSRRLTDLLQTKAVSYSDGKIEPIELTIHRDPDKTNLEHDLMSVACDAFIQKDLAHNLIYVATSAGKPHAELKISCLVLEALQDDATTVLSNQPVNHHLPLITSPEDILSESSLADFMGHGAAGLKAAINLELKKKHGIKTSPDFRFGVNFWHSIETNGLHKDIALFGKIARVAAVVLVGRAQDANLDLRHLRKTKTAGAPQQEREPDKAKAWRLTLTTNGIGWRMHFWAIPSSDGGASASFEFADVLKKNDAELITY
ncbi:hypothetical protein EJ065_3801 [Corallococcus coralloides]|uniref:Uncharacterized protein n=1 Tax=Corallococcus coralloides TaxID=184914 RepID=A0A410RU07_CORCK|nr:hypothetical protein [Corallococcus coralloides]QAT85362.1 hypothetical protein EJ065_3801 [Corallococcus coralloides]